MYICEVQWTLQTPMWGSTFSLCNQYLTVYNKKKIAQQKKLYLL